MSEQQIQNVIRNTQRRWFDDGAWEIVFGLINLILGGYFLAIERLNLDALWGSWLVLAQVLIILVIIGGVRYGVKFIKERITFPRTGYVVYKQSERAARKRRAFWRGLIAGSISATVAVMLSLSSATTPKLGIGITALILAGVCFYMALHFGVLRYAVTGFLTLLYGLVLLWLNLDLGTAIALLFIGYGGFTLLAGIFALMVFLRSTRPTQEEHL